MTKGLPKMSISAKIATAVAVSAGFLTAGTAAATADHPPAPTIQIAASGSNSGSSTLAETGSSGKIGDPLAMIACTLTGGRYIAPWTWRMDYSTPLGCNGGLLGRPTN